MNIDKGPSAANYPHDAPRITDIVDHLAVPHSQSPCLEDPAAVTVIICTAVSVAGALVQSRDPGLSELSQTKVVRMCTLEKVERWQVQTPECS